MKYGERIKQLRKARGMSAEDLAEKTGISPATIYRYENGTTGEPKRSMLHKIAKALNVDESQFNTVLFSTFPQRLSDIIGDRKCSYEQVADAIDVEAEDIDRMVSGDLEPTHEQFKALARFLNVTEDCLEGKTEKDIVDRDAASADDPWTLREELRRDPNRKALLKLARNGSAQDVRQAMALIDALRATNPDFYDGDDPA